MVINVYMVNGEVDWVGVTLRGVQVADFATQVAAECYCRRLGHGFTVDIAHVG